MVRRADHRFLGRIFVTFYGPNGILWHGHFLDGRLLEGPWQDLRYAFRSLRKSLGFAAVCRTRQTKLAAKTTVGGKQLSSLLFGAIVAVVLASAQSPSVPGPVTAWINGRWFDGASFQKRDMYTVGGRLTAKHPRGIDRTVDLDGGYVTPAFGEGHNHNIPFPNTAEMIRTYLSQGIFYVMIQDNVPGGTGTAQRPDQHARFD
jgi:hypothetical protein